MTTPTLYYATQLEVERNKVHFSKKARLTPRFIVCHPDDVPKIEKALRGHFSLTHIRHWKPTHLEDLLVIDLTPLPITPHSTTADLVTKFEESLMEKLNE